MLNSQISGIVGQIHSLDCPFCAAADLDHFGNVTEMVIHLQSTVETGQFDLGNYVFEIAVNVAP